MRRIPSEGGAFRAAETGGFLLPVVAAAASHHAAPTPHAIEKNTPASTQGRIDCRRSTTMGDAPVPEAAIRGGAVGVSARWVLARRARRTSSSGATVTRGLFGRTGWNESALIAVFVSQKFSPLCVQVVKIAVVKVSSHKAKRQRPSARGHFGGCFNDRDALHRRPDLRLFAPRRTAMLHPTGTNFSKLPGQSWPCAVGSKCGVGDEIVVKVGGQAFARLFEQTDD